MFCMPGSLPPLLLAEVGVVVFFSDGAIKALPFLAALSRCSAEGAVQMMQTGRRELIDPVDPKGTKSRPLQLFPGNKAAINASKKGALIALSLSGEHIANAVNSALSEVGATNPAHCYVSPSFEVARAQIHTFFVEWKYSV